MDILDEILGELYKKNIGPFEARREIEKLYQQARITPKKEPRGASEKIAATKQGRSPSLLGRKHITGR